MTEHVEDVQNHRDLRNIARDQTGVTDLRYPIVALDRDHQVQHTVASISISVGLPEEVKGTHMSRFVELVALTQAAASAPVYPLLKRPDNRHVTMQAYDHPAFVEDMVREVARSLQRDPRVGWFHIRAVNQESIHNYAAFAQSEWTREPSPTSVEHADATALAPPALP